MKYSLEELYAIAKKHKDNHKSCGGEPYKSFLELSKIVKSFGTSIRILEIGTAVGFTTFILSNPSPGEGSNFVDTIEFHQNHIEEAKKNILNWAENEKQEKENLKKIDFMQGDAKDILPTLSDNSYDLIFFDGYGAKLIFYNEFERILKVNGILITANQHLKSTEPEYFASLNNPGQWKLEEEFVDTKVYRKL